MTRKIQILIGGPKSRTVKKKGGGRETLQKPEIKPNGKEKRSEMFKGVQFA